ncbi:MAG: hypothetical protein PHN21_07865, partial [Erysipelotrichaceae bacterium]|nr:hypothetical protein [Erysipelotrichaceae bacterium]
TKDTDYNHGGVGHEFPHEHEWKNGKRQPGVSIPPVNKQIITSHSMSNSCWVKLTGVGLIIVAGIATIILIADDATVVGALNDPLIPVAVAGFEKGVRMVLQ